MPLPPLSPDNTERFWINYTSGLVGHSLQLRVPSGLSTGDLETKIEGIIEVMLPLMDPIDSVIGVDRAAAGSNVRFPFTVATGDGSATSTTNTLAARAAKISAVGKGTTGYLVSFNMFFLNAVFFTSPRVAIGVVAAAIADWWSALDATSPFTLRDINGDVFDLKAYVNTQQNQYWQRQLR